MSKRTGPTNPYLQRLIAKLKQKSIELNAPIWRAVAEKLEKPRRQRIEVNLGKIDRYTLPNETVVVPGIVLASGDITKPVTIAGWRFSSTAMEKIKEAGGKIISIEELMDRNPKGSRVKIIT